MSFVLLKSVWAYREFIFSTIRRELQAKYQNSLLGAAWNVINPLSMIIIYTLIFSRIMQAKLPGIDSVFAYSIYLCSGALTWALFSEIIGRGQDIFIQNANILKKVNFPKICLPVIVICNALINFFISFSLFTLFLLLTGNFPGLPYLAILPVLFILILFSIGIGVTLGVLNVFFRDVGQMFSIVLQFWFWFTPIVYPLSILPPSLQELMYLNPMYGVVLALQNILVQGIWPNWGTLLPATTLGFFLIGYGFRLFRKQSAELVDEL